MAKDGKCILVVANETLASPQIVETVIERAGGRAGRIGVVITTVGMLAYGGYQFWAATFQLGFMPNFHKLVGVVYAMLGIIAWFIGGDLRKGLN